MNTHGIRRAVAVLGTQEALAQAIGVTQGRVSQWCRGAPIPPEHCRSIEAATGVLCEELRPDLEWERDDAGSVSGYRVRLGAAPSKAEARAA